MPVVVLFDSVDVEDLQFFSVQVNPAERPETFILFPNSSTPPPPVLTAT
jgi:hypothetical protein